MLKVEPKNTRIYFYLIDNLLDGGRVTEAKEVLGEARVKAPDVLNDYYEIFIREKRLGFDSVKAEYEAMAQCARMLGKKDLAVSYYKKELELLREDWDFSYGSQVDEINGKIRELS